MIRVFRSGLPILLTGLLLATACDGDDAATDGGGGAASSGGAGGKAPGSKPSTPDGGGAGGEVGAAGSGGIEGGSETPVCVDAPEGLQIWWNQDDFGPMSPDWNDSWSFKERDVVEARPASVSGVASYGKGEGGPVGFALSFVEDLFLLDLGMGVPLSSFEFWIKTTDTSGSLMEVSSDYGVTLTAGGVVHVHFADIDAEVYTLDSSSAVNDGTPHHVVVTADALTNHAMYLYVDGELEDSVTLPETADPSSVGVAASPTFGGEFTGNLDEISLYSSVLDSETVSALFAAGSAGKCLP